MTKRKLTQKIQCFTAAFALVGLLLIGSAGAPAATAENQATAAFVEAEEKAAEVAWFENGRGSFLPRGNFWSG